jgi:hypothetical protein
VILEFFAAASRAVLGFGACFGYGGIYELNHAAFVIHHNDAPQNAHMNRRASV